MKTIDIFSLFLLLAVIASKHGIVDAWLVATGFCLRNRVLPALV